MECCRICRGDTGRRFVANGFDWFRCECCGTTQKVLTPQQYRDLNPTYDPGSFLDACDREQIEAFLDIEGAQKVLSGVIDEHLAGLSGSGKSFLDVGCGMGMYLLAAQRLGFEVLGFEPSSNHARVATEHFRLPVIADYFSAERVAGKKFDLIILSHVIEHIFDPKAFLHELVGVLKPGGALIVITPNNESFVARALGRSWPMLKPVDHVSLIGAHAYPHFALDGVAEVHHSTSEFPFEFAASGLAAAKSLISDSRRGRSTHRVLPAESKAPPLRGLGVKAKALRCLLSVVSVPMYAAAIAARRQACLKSVIVRSRADRPCGAQP
jgi:SAM-dependent methyltransferase